MSGDELGLGHNRCKKWKPGKKYTITIPRESELEHLVQWMMSISCQKFIWGAKVRSGKVTILSPEKVSLPEAYAAFYAGLETMGLTVEPAGDYFKIVESTGQIAGLLTNQSPEVPGCVVSRPDLDRAVEVGKGAFHIAPGP